MPKDTERKPVQHSATAEMEQAVEITGYAIGPDGEIELLKDGDLQQVARAWSEQSYERAKGPKVLNRVPSGEMKIRTGSLSELKKYRNVFSIDTNTREVEGVSVSVTVFGVAEVGIDDKGNPSLNGQPFGAFEFSGCNGNSERFGWWLLQHFIVNSDGYDRSYRYAIVADAHLGLHDAINAGSEPLFESTLLADNIDLLYATADAGADVLNFIIKDCDKRSSEFFAAFKTKEISHNDATNVVLGPCSKFRLWPFPGVVNLENSFRPKVSLPMKMEGDA